MNIDQYKITFSYGDRATINGSLYIHRGNDLPLRFEPVIIQGTQIGISGETGKAVGPHVHVQAGRDEWAQQTIDSAPYIGKPGLVFRTGEASEWGKYVCVKVGDVYVYYCHLSQINVKQGQEVGKMEEISLEIGRILYAFVGYDGIRNKPNALAGEMDGEITRATKGQQLDGNYIRSLYNSQAFKDSQTTLNGIWAEAQARRQETDSAKLEFVPVTEQLYKRQAK